MHRLLWYRDNPIGSSDPDPEPRKHYEVHCGQCHWWGMIRHMRTIYKPNPSKPGDVIPELGCPMCLSDQYLEYRNGSLANLEDTVAALRDKQELLLKILQQLDKDMVH